MLTKSETVYCEPGVFFRATAGEREAALIAELHVAKTVSALSLKLCRRPGRET
jgi:hypothetical protein